MDYGFIRIAAAIPEVRIGDCAFNTENIITQIKEASKAGVSIVGFPELCITGYSCGDLFFQSTLIFLNGLLLGTMADPLIFHTYFPYVFFF